MSASRRIARVAALAVVPAVAIAFPGCGSQSGTEPLATADSGLIFCGWGQAPSGDRMPEVYSLRAMNNKLRHFPDLAQTLGTQPGAVTNCGEARSFYNGYMTYLIQHPRFDANEPVELGPKVAAQPPAGSPPAKATRPKIFNGNPTFDVPIVQLSVLPLLGTAALAAFCNGGALGNTCAPPGEIGCTGTFIAKNWIATAAHCLLDSAASDAGWNPATPTSSGFPTWDRWYDWTINWADQNGNIAPQGGLLTLNTNVIQLADPNYIGFSPASTFLIGPTHDFALLYVPPDDNDGNLPPNPNTGSAMALSLVPPDFSHTLTAYGYGHTSNTDTSPPMLRSAPIQPNAGSDQGGIISEPAPPAGSQFGITCTGDSGGPLVDTVVNPDGNTQQVIVGTLQGSTPLAAGAICGNAPDAVTSWPDTASEVDFINQMIGSYGEGLSSTFACQTFTSANSANGEPDYEQCWGLPCQSDCDCPAIDTCFNPVNDVDSPFQPGISGLTIGAKTCDTCGVLGDCSCIMGQCQLRPDATSFLEAGSNCPQQ